jgi:hypothetical protein
MGLFTSLFSRGAGQSQRRDGRRGSAAEAGDSASPESRTHLRRELVHVVLRETMRSHGVPSDWLTAMVLPLPGQATRRGVHVLLVVRQGHEQMLAYMPAFQRSFFTGLRQFDSRASEWLAGLSWQFEGMPDHVGAATLPPLTVAAAAVVPAAADQTQAASVATSAEHDEDLQEDLRALFAIRDEAMQTPDSSSPESDFQPTQPLR